MHLHSHFLRFVCSVIAVQIYITMKRSGGPHTHTHTKHNLIRIKKPFPVCVKQFRWFVMETEVCNTHSRHH